MHHQSSSNSQEETRNEQSKQKNFHTTKEANKRIEDELETAARILTELRLE
jgi:hypothetical protein